MGKLRQGAGWPCLREGLSRTKCTVLLCLPKEKESRCCVRQPCTLLPHTLSKTWSALASKENLNHLFSLFSASCPASSSLLYPAKQTFALSLWFFGLPASLQIPLGLFWLQHEVCSVSGLISQPEIAAQVRGEEMLLGDVREQTHPKEISGRGVWVSSLSSERWKY